MHILYFGPANKAIYKHTSIYKYIHTSIKVLLTDMDKETLLAQYNIAIVCVCG